MKSAAKKECGSICYQTYTYGLLLEARCSLKAYPTPARHSSASCTYMVCHPLCAPCDEQSLGTYCSHRARWHIYNPCFSVSMQVHLLRWQSYGEVCTPRCCIPLSCLPLWNTKACWAFGLDFGNSCGCLSHCPNALSHPAVPSQGLAFRGPMSYRFHSWGWRICSTSRMPCRSQ